MKAKVQFALAALACALLHSAGARAGWFGPDNYEECMVSEMRDQDRSMYWTVDRLCSKRFKREFQLALSRDEMDWGYKNFTLTIVIRRTDFEVTRGKFSFSGKLCDQTEGEKDFTVTKEAKFDDGVANFVIEELFVPRCMKTREVWGRYR